NNITWKRGELQRVPVDDSSMDLVLLSQALHHADEPQTALTEAHRILRPGGRVLLLDLREHDETWVTSTLGDRWLGFDEKSLKSLLDSTGSVDTVVRVGASRAGGPFAVLIGAGTRRGRARD